MTNPLSERINAVMALDKQELKPCPFCESDAFLTPTWKVTCSNNAKPHYRCPVAEIEFVSVEQWNTRPRETELLSIITEMQGYMDMVEFVREGEEPQVGDLIKEWGNLDGRAIYDISHQDGKFAYHFKDRSFNYLSSLERIIQRNNRPVITLTAEQYNKLRGV